MAGILEDVFADPFVFIKVANDVLVVVPLPDSFASAAQDAIDLDRRNRPEGSDDISQDRIR